MPENPDPDTTDATDATDIPARRLPPKDHLARAAKSSLGSDTERYHLAAAQAEALWRMADTLDGIAASLRVLEARRIAHLTPAAVDRLG